MSSHHNSNSAEKNETGITDFVVVIPARFESSRLPGKVLADINGKPMIQWVVEKAQQSGARQVIVATDNDDVAAVVASFGGEVCKTRAEHQSGTERLSRSHGRSISLAMMKLLLMCKEMNLSYRQRISPRWRITLANQQAK